MLFWVTLTAIVLAVACLSVQCVTCTKTRACNEAVCEPHLLSVLIHIGPEAEAPGAAAVVGPLLLHSCQLLCAR